ncbi:hypothetical protein AX15_007732 [Amanita polypyramis BW_CC]|nr:hypothetical protein AX15_007732 [Amanita polypyramis BW_CC]
MTSIMLSRESVADIAEDILIPLQCEWRMPGNGKPCAVVLGSLHLLNKHLLVHSRTKTHDHANWLCKLPKCNAPVHSSMQTLQHHIKHSHLSSVPLPCPFISCTSQPFIRFGQLANHFDKEHDELNERTITLPCPDLLLPLWMPFMPASNGIPHLPVHTFPGTCLMKTVTASPAINHMQADLSSSQQVATKQSHQLLKNWTEPEESLPTMVFDSLTKEDPNTLEDDHKWFSALDPGWSALRDTSRPQAMHGLIHRQAVPATIHYAVFAKRVKEMEKAGYFK